MFYIGKDHGNIRVALQNSDTKATGVACTWTKNFLKALMWNSRQDAVRYMLKFVPTSRGAFIFEDKTNDVRVHKGWADYDLGN